MELKIHEDDLKKHYSEVHADLEELGLGLTHDQHGRLACKLKDTMLTQLFVFRLANKQ